MSLSLSLVTIHDAGINPRSVNAADVNGDGNLDVIVTNSTGPITVLLGDGDGGFRSSVTYGHGSSDPIAIYPTDPQPITTPIADVSGDGIRDAVIVDPVHGIKVLYGDGSGGFATSTSYAAGPSVVAVAAADLNGDGRLDLLGGNGGSSAQLGVDVLLADGQGGFGAPVVYDGGASVTSVITADVNGDGKPDIVLGTAGGNADILLSDGRGGFGAATAYDALGSQYFIAADLNRDGVVDLIGVGQRAGFTVMLGAGHGFSAPVYYNQGTRFPTVADLNGDDKPDLIITDNRSNTVDVLLGDGQGGFAPPVAFVGRPGPSSVTTADLNGDGRPDVIVGDIYGSVSVLLNTSTDAPCFAQGTLIHTPRGQIPVERLRAGDCVLTAAGRHVAIAWLGHRAVDCRRHPRPQNVWPVRVAAGAFGDGRPSRDLLLSLDHAVFADGALIPVRYLVNGATVRQEAVDAITYWHVELPRHDVLLAEGLPCESYLDTGNRAAFANGGRVAMAHPDFAPDFAMEVWRRAACAPLALAGPVRDTVHARLLATAGLLGHAATDDPGLHLLADGVVVRPAEAGSARRFTLPAGARDLRLMSRRFVPAALRSASDDHRSLGVAVAALAADGVRLPLSALDGRQGWHANEAGWRWTNGSAELPCVDARTLDVVLGPPGAYWREAAPDHRQAA